MGNSRIELTVQVVRSELIKTLRANRAAHVEAYTAAYQAWREQTATELADVLEAFRNGETERTSVGYNPKPTSYQSDYDTAIGLLELSEQDSIPLSANDYRRFVQDKWDWKEEFIGTNATYGVFST